MIYQQIMKQSEALDILQPSVKFLNEGCEHELISHHNFIFI